TVLTTHGSGGEVLFTLPEFTLPRLLGGFTVGGAVEAPILAQVTAEVIPIVGIMAAFGAFNSVVAHHELLRAVPKAFHEPALVVTVAVTLVPSTMRAVQTAREADRSRSGHRSARGRSRRTLLPVLETGLERAVSLAESMDARGFARRDPSPAEQVASWATLAGLLSLAGSFLALIAREDQLAGLLAVGGAVLVATAILATSRASEITRYRPRRLDWLDAVVMAVALAAPVGLGLLAAVGEPSLTWTTNPLEWPTLGLGPLVFLTLLLAPALAPPAS
ncbi:MAG: hypothetical protein AAGK32_12490, partial [Actinomycetota bacterium]